MQKKEKLVDYAVSKAISDQGPEQVAAGIIAEARDVFTQYISGFSKYDATATRLKALALGNEALDIVREIMRTDDNPIPYKNHNNNFGSIRKKTRQWTHTEDIRLLTAMLKHGIEDWQQIANFVGNGRVRSQCSQRWLRGLNPKIKKTPWTEEEDRILLNLIQIHGEKAWSKIATDMGDRCDVQCRYHYNQSKKNPNSIFTSSKIVNADEGHGIEEPIEVDKPGYNSGMDPLMDDDELMSFSYLENLDSKEQMFFQLTRTW